MPHFHYQAKDGPESLVEGVIEAATETAAVEKISQLGLVPVRIGPNRGSASATNTIIPVFSSSSRRRKQVMRFSRSLASLIKSGVSVLKAIWILSAAEKDANFKIILDTIARHIKEGKTLSEAFEAYPDTFSPMYIATVRAGENSGAMQEVLTRLADYLKKDALFRSKLSRAMIYPAILLTTGVATLVFLLSFMVPKLTQVFVSLNHQLPLPTRIIIAAGNFMQVFWPVVVILVLLVWFVIPWLLAKYLGREAIDAWKLSMPGLGKFAFKSDFSKFARTLELSLTNGVPFIHSLQVATPVLDNHYLRTLIEDATTRILKGETFGRALATEPDVFPDFVTNLISVGEETGRLQEVLMELADGFEQDVDSTLEVATTLIEPLMILMIGGIVGFIAIGMLLPIFEMNTIF